MLCQKCWKEEATVHFTTLGDAEAQERAYCLSCAHDEPLSWLLAWGHGLKSVTGDLSHGPEVIPSGLPFSRRRATTLVATGMTRCACGCRIVVGAEIPCGHASCAPLDAPTTLVEHICHCGRQLQLRLPVLYCPRCSLVQSQVIIASAETCAWDQRRRHMVAVDHDLRGGRVTWGTFSIMN